MHFLPPLQTLQYLEEDKDLCDEKMRLYFQTQSQKPLPCEGQFGLLPLRKETAFDSFCILKPAGTVSYGEAKYCKHEFTQNLRLSMAMRTDLTA